MQTLEGFEESLRKELALRALPVSDPDDQLKQSIDCDTIGFDHNENKHFQVKESTWVEHILSDYVWWDASTYAEEKFIQYLDQRDRGWELIVDPTGHIIGITEVYDSEIDYDA